MFTSVLGIYRPKTEVDFKHAHILYINIEWKGRKRSKCIVCCYYVCIASFMKFLQKSQLFIVHKKFVFENKQENYKKHCLVEVCSSNFIFYYWIDRKMVMSQSRGSSNENQALCKVTSLSGKSVGRTLCNHQIKESYGTALRSFIPQIYRSENPSLDWRILYSGGEAWYNN